MKRSILLIFALVLTIGAKAQMPAAGLQVKVVNTTSCDFYIEFQSIYNCLPPSPLYPTLTCPAGTATLSMAPPPSDMLYLATIHDSNPPVGTCFNVTIKAPYWFCGTPTPATITGFAACCGMTVTVTWDPSAAVPTIYIS